MARDIAPLGIGVVVEELRRHFVRIVVGVTCHVVVIYCVEGRPLEQRVVLTILGDGAVSPRRRGSEHSEQQRHSCPRQKDSS